jgi:hypothetical protein
VAQKYTARPSVEEQEEEEEEEEMAKCIFTGDREDGRILRVWSCRIYIYLESERITRD